MLILSITNTHLDYKKSAARTRFKNVRKGKNMSTAKTTRTIETTVTIDTEKLKSKLKTASMPFVGASDYTNGLYIALDSNGCAVDLNEQGNTNEKFNGIYFMAECLQTTSDAEIAFIRKNFDVRPFEHTYYSGRNSYTLDMSAKDIRDSNDGDFASIARKQGLAIATGKTAFPENSPALERAKSGSKLMDACLMTGGLSAAAAVLGGIIGVFSSFAVGAVLFPIAGYCLAAVGVSAAVGLITKLACNTGLISRKFKEVNNDKDHNPLTIFKQMLDAKIDANTTAPVEKVKRKPATRAKKLTVVANDVFEKPEIATETPSAAPAAPAKKHKKEITL